MECTVMMVAIDSIGTEVYVPVQMNIMDGMLPQNNSHDIMRVVSICNDSKDASPEPVEFIDMYGLLANDKLEMWENLNE